jgi:DUF1365 family protein
VADVENIPWGERILTSSGRYPAMSLQVVAKIYAQSLRLKLKGTRHFPHPEGKRPKGFVRP